MVQAPLSVRRVNGAALPGSNRPILGGEGYWETAILAPDRATLLASSPLRVK